LLTNTEELRPQPAGADDPTLIHIYDWVPDDTASALT